MSKAKNLKESSIFRQKPFLNEPSKIIKMSEEDSLKESIVLHPKPGNFDVFMLWACKEYHIMSEVIVTRCLQETYVSASAVNKKRPQEQKLTKQRTITTTRSLALHEDEENNSSDEKKIPKVYKNVVNIGTVYDSNEHLVQVKFLMNKEIPRKIMQVLALAIPFQQHLTSITINRGLEMDSLYELSKCLPGSQITELCLDDTFISQANYYILLTNSKLQHLSLARCSLNDSVVQMIAEKLKEPCPAARVLSALNLSTNRITDVGAKYLAEVLRSNRRLSYLNLAGNAITDKGSVSILNTLQKFPLHPHELVENGARYVAHLKKRNDLINTYISDIQTPTSTKSSRKKLRKRTRIESPSMHQHFDLSAETQIIRRRAELFADSKLASLSEPFFPNNTETCDGVMYCFGNNTLCCLNFSYNSLTYVTLKKLLEVLVAQQYYNRSPKGLIRVVIEGNLMPVDCKELKEIDDILGSGMEGSRKISKRKPLSAKSVIR